jgi:hypothetical protein
LAAVQVRVAIMLQIGFANNAKLLCDQSSFVIHRGQL